jgi:hypothetical protein
MRTAVVVFVITLFATLVSGSQPGTDADGTKIVPVLDKAQREAIVAAANQAFGKHVKGERKKEAPDEIVAANWGEAITKLKPIRVRNDRVNLAIVLSEKDGMEEGLYVSIPISSYLPRIGDRFTYIERLSTKEDKSFGTIYHYKLQPKAK